MFLKRKNDNLNKRDFVIISGLADRMRKFDTSESPENKIVLVPTFKDKNDKLVLKIFKKHFKNRKIIPIDCSLLIWGFGAIHCMTQQEPR